MGKDSDEKGELAQLTAQIVKFRDERDWKQFQQPKRHGSFSGA